MKNLTATLCLTLALILGSAGVSWSADYNKGLAASQRGDHATALREWMPLAKQGDVGAQFAVGMVYLNGEGVPRDHKTAAKWFLLAAAQGSAGAQFNLGVMYAEGSGVPFDELRAAMWFDVVVKSGESSFENAVKYRNRISNNISDDEFSKLEDLIRECEKKKYKGC